MNPYSTYLAESIRARFIAMYCFVIYDLYTWHASGSPCPVLFMAMWDPQAPIQPHLQACMHSQMCAIMHTYMHAHEINK